MGNILKIPVVIAVLALGGCAEKQIDPRGAAQIRQDERREFETIDRQLRSRCPTPGNLTPAELRAVAGDIGQAARHWQRTAAEYDRLDSESRICRGQN